MKFNQRLGEEMVPEWKAKYVEYKELKKLIKSIRNEAIALAKAYTEIKSKWFI